MKQVGEDAVREGTSEMALKLSNLIFMTHESSNLLL